jgi:hypothetical protein
MKEVAKVFYSEPVVFLGVCVGVVTALVAGDVIPEWSGLVAVAVATPFQRHFVKPKKVRR